MRIRRTKRLTIRPLTARDFLPWKSAHSAMGAPRNSWDRKGRPASELTRRNLSTVLKSQKDLRKADSFYDLAVFLNSTGEFIGGVSAMNVMRGPAQSTFLGYAIFNAHWGKGYGKEAVRAMIDIIFRDLKLHRLEAGIEPTNRRSILLARSLGLRKEGLKKRAVFLNRRWVDLVIYSATCEEFGIRWKGKTETRLR